VIARSQLYWLPPAADWRADLGRVAREPNDRCAWDKAVALANTRLDFIRTNALDAVVRRRFGGDAALDGVATMPVRLAILGSCTLTHLLPGIRMGGLRRGICITSYENDYGQYLQELFDPDSPLHQFEPNAVLFSFDRFHLTAGLSAADGVEADAILADSQQKIRRCWGRAREAFKCSILQQTVLAGDTDLLGNNEHRLPGSRNRFVARLNAVLRDLADREGVDLVAVDTCAARDGLAAWHDIALWHRTKQDILPSMAPTYGDLVARLLGAKQGRSSKCLVLDLDDTIWGGIIGDDGLEGIVLGQGNGLGEAFAAMQAYARELSRRGVILAVCSKNDERNVIEVFDQHPEMILTRGDIACLVANWQDKATNLRAIAEELNIGLDSLVFVDDNPVERDLIRRELPMVAVPEVPDDPSYVPQCLADAGYFEAVAITSEDRERTRQYQGNRARERLRRATTDLPSYLRGLEMRLLWQRLGVTGLPRVVQLINKTNQYNLTTRRYSEEEVRAIIADSRFLGLQLRLVDRFGDNGIIGIIVGTLCDNTDMIIDTWLMSCRVLGRQVEQTTLNLIVGQARRLGARRLIGEYRPTKKNSMVENHYQKLGFKMIDKREDTGSRNILDLDQFFPFETFIEVEEAYS
jgi:FkbH-like protein